MPRDAQLHGQGDVYGFALIAHKPRFLWFPGMEIF
jgi:hypothetical protein